MRARLEPTRLEHLSDPSFLGKLLMFPANVRLDWKVIARYKHSSTFGLIVSDKGKKFYYIDTRCQFNKHFTLDDKKIFCVMLVPVVKFIHILYT